LHFIVSVTFEASSTTLKIQVVHSLYKLHSYFERSLLQVKMYGFFSIQHRLYTYNREL